MKKLSSIIPFKALAPTRTLNRVDESTSQYFFWTAVVSIESSLKASLNWVSVVVIIIIELPPILLQHPWSYRNCVWCKYERVGPIQYRLLGRRSWHWSFYRSVPFNCVIVHVIHPQVGFGLYPVLVKKFNASANPLIFSLYRWVCRKQWRHTVSGNVRPYPCHMTAKQ